MGGARLLVRNIWRGGGADAGKGAGHGSRRQDINSPAWSPTGVLSAIWTARTIAPE